MAAQRFLIRVEPRFRLVLRLFGVRDGNAWVDLDDDAIEARFGRFRVRTHLSNVTRWRIEGPGWR